MTLRTDTAAGISEKRSVSRRRFLAAASTGIAGSTIADSALADTLADVPPREPGAPLSGRSERSQYVKLNRIPEAGPGLRHVDPNDAINSKTPLNKLVGSITPTDLASPPASSRLRSKRARTAST